MKGIRITETILINAHQDEVFNFTQDYSKRLSWDTFLTKAELMDGASAAGMKVKAYCVAKNGLGMITEYVSFNPPKSTAVKMTKGPYLFKSFLGSWNFKEIQPNQTEVIFLYSYELRFPFTLFTPLIRSNLRKNVKQRLLDLKANLEQISLDH